MHKGLSSQDVPPTYSGHEGWSMHQNLIREKLNPELYGKRPNWPISNWNHRGFSFFNPCFSSASVQVRWWRRTRDAVQTRGPKRNTDAIPAVSTCVRVTLLDKKSER